MKELKQKKKRGNPGIPEEIWAKAREILEEFPQASPKIILYKLYEAFPPEHKLSGSLPMTERTIRNHISELRPPNPTELDEPWSLGALVKYPIPPEALPAVMEIYHDRLKYAESWEPDKPSELGEILLRKFLGKPSVLTIRQALWIGRLCRIPFPNKPMENKSVLWDSACLYAMLERRAQTTGMFNTREYDKLMFNGEFPIEQLIHEIRSNHERQHTLKE